MEEINRQLVRMQEMKELLTDLPDADTIYQSWFNVAYPEDKEMFPC